MSEEKNTDIIKHKIELLNISKKFGDRQVLHNINFFVDKGEFVSILGPSGSGKTTILRIIIGLEKPTSGSVFKDGTNITAYPIQKRGIGIVFQSYALFKNMTVLENVSYPLIQNKYTKKDAKAKALVLLEQVGLLDHLNKYPHMLSGGQQQRVAIARTLALNPDVILFDEPMSALDAATRLTLRDELKALQKRTNTTMIYITHDSEEAFSLSSRIIVMDDKGTIHQIDKPENILSAPADDYVKTFVNDNLEKKYASLKVYMG